MKSILILLSFSAVVIADSQSETTHQLIANFSNKVVENFDKLIADVKAFTSKGATRAKDIVAGISSQIELEEEAFQKDIKDVVGENASGNDCVTNVLIDTTKFLKDSSEKVQVCGSDTFSTLNSFEDGIVNSINQLKSMLGSLVNLAKECKNDRNCVIGQINDSKKMFTDTMDKFEGIIEQAKGKIENLIVGIKGCAVAAFEGVLGYLEEARNKTEECLQ